MDESINDIIQSIRNIEATEKLSACDVVNFTNWYEVEVDFGDTIQTNQGSFQRHFSDAKELLEMLSELEDICENN